MRDGGSGLVETRLAKRAIRDRYPDPALRYGLPAIIAFALGLAALLISRPLPDTRLLLADNLLQALGPLLVGGWAIALTVRRNQGMSRRIWPARLLALGGICWGLGQLVWTYYERVLQRPVPLVAWSDLLFFAVYPLILLGIFGLPRQPLTLPSLVRTLFEGLLIAVTAASYCWYFLLGPTLLLSTQPAAIKAITTLYPLCDLALLCALLWVGLRPGCPVLGASLRLLLVGLGLIVVNNLTFQFLVLRDAYATGMLMDIAWPLGYMLIGLAAIGTLREGTTREASPAAPPLAVPHFDARPRLWRAMIPYLSLPIVGGLLAHAWYADVETALVRGLLGIGVLLLGVVIVHQALVIAESWQFARDLDSVYRITLGRMEELDRLQHLASTDPLTGVLNRRGLNAVLDEAVARADALDTPFAVVLLDLDRFKTLNDTYGHLAGDEALRDLAGLLRGRQRGDARAGRWGGEEFLLVLPAADELGALEQAEALRAQVAAHECAAGGGIRFTCSIGIAVYPQDARDATALLAAADRAMYTAKCLGRNQVFSAADPAVATLMADVGAESSRGGEALASTVEALAALVKVRDQYDRQHADEVARLSVQIALACGCSVTEAHQIGIAGRLHDVGKVTVPDAVLRKASPLSDEEWAQMRLHPATGAAIIEQVPGLRFLAPLIHSHHERWDGGGYPEGLTGTAIPLGARIIAVTEAYGALIANRPYRTGRTPAEALAELRRCAGSQFDPTLVQTLERVLHIPPRPDTPRSTGPLRATTA